MQPLTERQQAILEYIQQAIDEKGYPPTLREIGARMDIRSTNGVSDHLRALERKGYLERIGMKSRALRPTKVGRTFLMQNRDTGDELPEKVIRVDRDDRPANDAIAIPLFNRIAAGPLSTIDERVERYLHVDPSMLRGGGETFALRVKGESMIEADINDGDTVIIEPGTPKHGDIVAALIDGETTLKRLIKQGSKVYLKAENSNYPNLTPVSSLVIQGIAKQVVKAI